MSLTREQIHLPRPRQLAKECGLAIRTGEHALIHDGVARQKEAIAGELREIWVADFINVSWDKLVGRNISP